MANKCDCDTNGGSSYHRSDSSQGRSRSTSPGRRNHDLPPQEIVCGKERLAEAERERTLEEYKHKEAPTRRDVLLAMIVAFRKNRNSYWEKHTLWTKTLAKKSLKEL